MSSTQDSIIADRQGVIRAIDQKAVFVVAVITLMLQVESDPIVIKNASVWLPTVSLWAGSFTILLGFAIIWPRGIRNLSDRTTFEEVDIKNLNKVMSIKNLLLEVAIVSAVLTVLAWVL